MTTERVLINDETIVRLHGPQGPAGSGGGGSGTFVGLTDTPAAYTGAGLDLVRVNAAADALEYLDPASLSVAWAQLTGVPATFTPASHTHTLSEITDAGTAAAAATGDFEASGAVATHAAATSGVHGITAYAATLLDDANAAAARSTLGLGTAATSATGDFAAASHAHSTADLTSGTLAVLRGGTGASTLPALPSYYTAGAATVTGHLTGIDDALGRALRWDRVYTADGGGSALGTGGARTIRERRPRRIDGVTIALDATDTGQLTIVIAAGGVTQHTGTATITASSEATLSITWDTGDGSVAANETITVSRSSGFSAATVLVAELYGEEVS